MKISRIIATIGDYSHVVVDRETFDQVNGFKPALPYTTAVDAQGRGVRVYTVDGVPLYSRKDKETGKSVFVMRSLDAAERFAPSEDALDFAI
jgi:hypothetical protein